MQNSKKELVTIEAKVNAPIEKVWELWTGPEHIIKWNTASEDWHTTSAENDLRIGGKFSSRMEAKDGSFGFDFGGIYSEVDEHERIVYTLDDDRKVWTTFTKIDGGTEVISTFEAESENPVDMQKGGWQSILDNFKKYSENSK
ncbi:MAG: polyketide cyclase [Ignavibacteriae bacterium HGW-Ignavibacteriae-4]|nr:MAG: polyketide cyclase [Ignavibacteriae bacterium HGW-Ignavibacteriae-4]